MPPFWTMTSPSCETGSLSDEAYLPGNKFYAAINEALKQAKSKRIVFYLAPDEDLDMFRNMFLDNVEDLPDSIQVYSSESDGAISMSRGWYAKYPRLGRSLLELTPEDRKALADGTDGGFIECSNAQKHAGKGKSGHGYWYGNPWVSGDIALALRTRRLPGERGLVRSEDGAVWEFPDDYPERLAKIAAQVAATGSDR